MKFSLIMPTLGRSDDVECFLSSLDLQTYECFELIVADQNGDDRLAPILARYDERFAVTHLRLDTKGASRARNAGLDLADGDIIAFPDDDCRYEPETLDRIARFMANHPEIGGLTGRSVDERGKTNMGDFDQSPGTIRKSNIWKCGIEYTMFLRADAIGDTRFDESIGPGAGTACGAGEGTEFMLRIMARGAVLHYDPSLTVSHPSQVPPYDAKAARKTYSYGYGMGYVLKNNDFPAWIKAKYLLRPLGGALLALAGSRTSEANYRWHTFNGRLKGLSS
jgi:glycosyltransferase involved in cell wall biosynthesis